MKTMIDSMKSLLLWIVFNWFDVQNEHIKVVWTATVSCTDLLENDTEGVYWWEKFTYQVLIFSKKAFSSYGSYTVWKTPLTYCVLGFWQFAKFTELAQFQKTCFLPKLWFEPFIQMLFAKSYSYFVCKILLNITISIIFHLIIQYRAGRVRLLVLFRIFMNNTETLNYKTLKISQAKRVSAMGMGLWKQLNKHII